MKTTLLLCILTVLGSSLRAQVIPPDAVVEGKTIAEWSAEWWKWAFSWPTNQNPWPPLTIEELRQLNADYIESATGLYLIIDGVTVPNLFAYRAISPVFTFFFETPDNIESYVAQAPVIGLNDPIVSDGYWVMVEPLALGDHTIEFGGTFGPPLNFSLNITNRITVVPASVDQRIQRLLDTVSADLPGSRPRPLAASLNAARASLEAGNVRAGVNQLRAFVSKVRAQIAPSDRALAEELIRAAQQIIEKAETE